MLAAGCGLALPLVYNTGGYDSPEALALLDGVVDVYMPDVKYGDSAVDHRYSHVRDYVEVNQATLREMHRQVGDLVVDADGVARRGLLVRHSVLPAKLADTERVFDFLAREISPRTHVKLMAQYHPGYRTDQCPPLDRPITREEWQAARAVARRSGLPLVGAPRRRCHLIVPGVLHPRRGQSNLDSGSMDGADARRSGPHYERLSAMDGMSLEIEDANSSRDVSLLVGTKPDYQPGALRAWVPREPPSGARMIADEAFRPASELHRGQDRTARRGAFRSAPSPSRLALCAEGPEVTSRVEPPKLFARSWETSAATAQVARTSCARGMPWSFAAPGPSTPGAS